MSLGREGGDGVLVLQFLTSAMTIQEDISVVIWDTAGVGIKSLFASMRDPGEIGFFLPWQGADSVSPRYLESHHPWFKNS